MNILVVGSGGREHAIVWRLSKSESVNKIFCAPGNGGISDIAQCLDIRADDIGGLLKFAKENDIYLTVVGPEVPLAAGIVDKFNEDGLRIFGPAKELANLEASKVFAKEAMRRFGIPTAGFEVFTDYAAAKQYLASKNTPIVIKADGLCAGKGVIVASTLDEADAALKSILVDKIFKDAGSMAVIEDCLIGEEASILAFSDGKTIVPLASSQDHKRVFDNDLGPNTGGMGAYSPAPVVTDKLLNEVLETVFKPLINGLSKEGKIYKGVLYAGIMTVNSKLFVLEFNVRFGDPEAQAILPRFKSDLVDVMDAIIDGDLDAVDLKWDKRPCVSVVVASGGYPGNYETGKEIFGLHDAKKIKDVIVFHAGTKKIGNSYFTAGGRALNITALGDTIKDACDKAYEAVKLIKFEGMHYRKDIASRAIKTSD